MMIPVIDAKRKGAIEKVVMPSIAKLNNPKKFHEDSPAARSARSKVISFFIAYPTKQPFGISFRFSQMA